MCHMFTDSPYTMMHYHITWKKYVKWATSFQNIPHDPGTNIKLRSVAFHSQQYMCLQTVAQKYIYSTLSQGPYMDIKNQYRWPISSLMKRNHNVSLPNGRIEDSSELRSEKRKGYQWIKQSSSINHQKV